MDKLTREQVIKIIEKLINAEGTEEEQDRNMELIEDSVPFYQELVKLIFWSNENLKADEIYEKAMSEYKPINL